MLQNRSCAFMTTSTSRGSLWNDYGHENYNAANRWYDCLNEEKESCCTCGAHLSTIHWRSLPNNDVNFKLWGSDDRCSKSFLCTVFIKAIRTNHGKDTSSMHSSWPIIAKHLTYRKALFSSDSFVAATILAPWTPYFLSRSRRFDRILLVLVLSRLVVHSLLGTMHAMIGYLPDCFVSFNIPKLFVCVF